MKTRPLLLVLLLLPLCGMAANTIKTNGNTVTSAITLTDAQDYTLTHATPFANGGSVNITNDKAVLILANIKPSVAISTWLKYVKIKGSAAVNGTNCQVKMYGKYGHGTIILPYASTLKPLTCYTGENFSGTACTDYTTGSNGGYMKTLTESQLANNIRSFKLRRGYMVTFAVGTAGWGYSRCFIADTEDLEISALPTVLSGKISSYRVFPWQDAHKSGVGGDSSTGATNALNASWTFTWGLGDNRLPDVEMVPHKLHKNWPGVGEVGAAEYSAHAKTDNEPANSADDQPGTVEEILGYWENLMRTGQRLCSPSTYDGSNNADWFARFFAAIDARGWRCDIYDRHCYWTSVSQLQSDYNTYHRPIWISELMYGASWNKNGIFTVSDPSSNSSSNQTALYNGAKPIVDALNKYPYVERYAWWNSENVCSKVYYNGALTTFGNYYANMNTGLAYNKAYEYVPQVVITKPNNPNTSISGNQVTLSWTDPNGDMIDAIEVQYMRDGETTWTTLGNVTPKDKSGSGAVSYTATYTIDAPEECVFRIVDVYEGREYSTAAQVRSSGWLTTFPANYDEFYFIIYSAEAQTDLCWTLGWNGGNTDIMYQTPSEIGTNPNQVWQIEENTNSEGYNLRNMGAYDYAMCSPQSWNFTTSNASYRIAKAETGYLPEYQGDYWTIKNCKHSSCYVGLWDDDKNFAAGERLAGNRNSISSADHLRIYAIRKEEYNQKYMVEQHHYNARHTLLNPDWTWGNASSTKNSSGYEYQPWGWQYDNKLSGWNDCFFKDQKISDGTTAHIINLWAGTVTQFDLSQTVHGLPNGVYRLSSDLATTSGYAPETTKTALYALTGTESTSARSEYITGTGEDAFNPYECLVTVDHHQLTIKARSDGTWFKVSPLRLEYLCDLSEASPEQRQQILTGRVLYSGYLRGDVNLDGNVDVNDVTALVDIILGKRVDVGTGDIDLDGNIDVNDVTQLVNIILNK